MKQFADEFFLLGQGLQVLVFAGDNKWYPQQRVDVKGSFWSVKCHFGDLDGSGGGSYKIVAVLGNELNQAMWYSDLPKGVRSNTVQLHRRKEIPIEKKLSSAIHDAQEERSQKEIFAVQLRDCETQLTSMTWLHQIAAQDKQNIQHLVKVFLIDWDPHLSDDKPNPYIDFGFGIFNGSVYDLEILNPINGYISFWREGKDDPDGFKDPARLKLEEGRATPVIRSRSAQGVWVRQWLTEKEAQFIESSSQNSTFWFSELHITMKGEGFDFRLYTGERMKKGKRWQSYDNPSVCLAFEHSDFSARDKKPTDQ